jgi:hypothetical protein
MRTKFSTAGLVVSIANETVKVPLRWLLTVLLGAFGVSTATALDTPTDLSGDWEATAQGCERAGSFLAGVAASPGTVVRIAQSGTYLTINVIGHTKDGEEYSFPAPGSIKDGHVVMFDPLNSSYPFVGEFVADTISIRPDTRRTLRGWPAWANPPAAADLDACRVTLRRMAAGAASPEAQAVHRNPYEGIPPYLSALLDRDSLIAKSNARELERKLDALRKERGRRLAVLLVASVSPEPIEAFASRAKHAYGVGTLIVIANTERAAFLALDEEDAARIPPDLARAWVQDAVMPALNEGNIVEAVSAAIDAVVAGFDTAPLGVAR